MFGITGNPFRSFLGDKAEPLAFVSSHSFGIQGVSMVYLSVFQYRRSIFFCLLGGLTVRGSSPDI